MTDPVSLLPANATPLERAIAAATGRISAIPAPIDAVARPYDVPATFLPFVGWGRSVDVWDRRWAETRRRAVVDQAIRLHRIKGTAAALRETIRHADGEVLEIVRPPMKVFSGASLSRLEREAWLASLPQVRIWSYRAGTVAAATKAFHGGFHHGLFIESAYAVPSTALSRLRRRARWVVNGVEAEIKVTEFGSYSRAGASRARQRRRRGGGGGRLRFFAPLAPDGSRIRGDTRIWRSYAANVSRRLATPYPQVIMLPWDELLLLHREASRLTLEELAGG